MFGEDIDSIFFKESDTKPLIDAAVADGWHVKSERRWAWIMMPSIYFGPLLSTAVFDGLVYLIYTVFYVVQVFPAWAAKGDLALQC